MADLDRVAIRVAADILEPARNRVTRRSSAAGRTAVASDASPAADPVPADPGRHDLSVGHDPAAAKPARRAAAWAGSARHSARGAHRWPHGHLASTASAVARAPDRGWVSHA